MRKILKFLSFLILILGIFFLHLFVINCLPTPFNHINVIFLAILWLIILSVSKDALMVSLPLAFLLELYTSQFFGIYSLSLIISLSVINWFLMNIFTNRSIYIMFLSCFFGLFLYKFLFIVLIILGDFLLYFKRNLFFSWESYLLESFWEIILTSFLGVLFLFTLSLFFKSLNPKYIKLDKKNIYEVRSF